MAKTPKLKKSTKPSTNSRASRRATSPALENNLDKSLRNLPRPSSPPIASKVLAPKPNAGITKKKSGKKPLKRKQKIRMEHGREKAEAVVGKLERKVERAERKGEWRRGRNADWDDLNEKLSGKRRSKNKFKNLSDDNGDDDGWEDQPMDATTTNIEAIAKIPLEIDGAETRKEPAAITVDTGGDVEDEIS